MLIQQTLRHLRLTMPRQMLSTSSAAIRRCRNCRSRIVSGCSSIMNAKRVRRGG